MAEEYLYSGKHIDSTMFDNQEDSDIILAFRHYTVYAHRVVLRMWSPFFQSRFSDRSRMSSLYFLMDDACDGEYWPKALYAVLKHIYGMPFGSRLNASPPGISEIEFAIKVYKMASQYDTPSVRHAAVSVVQRYLDDSLLGGLNLEKSILVTCCISNICGPAASKLADPKLHDTLFSWLSANFTFMSEDPKFKAKVENGSLLNAEWTAKLLFALGAQIESTGKKRKFKSGGLYTDSP